MHRTTSATAARSTRAARRRRRRPPSGEDPGGSLPGTAAPRMTEAAAAAGPQRHPAARPARGRRRGRRGRRARGRTSRVAGRRSGRATLTQAERAPAPPPARSTCLRSKLPGRRAGTSAWRPSARGGSCRSRRPTTTAAAAAPARADAASRRTPPRRPHPAMAPRSGAARRHRGLHARAARMAGPPGVGLAVGTTSELGRAAPRAALALHGGRALAVGAGRRRGSQAEAQRRRWPTAAR
mmetsp:Transcript_126197/g.365252  ORF Transcript_126197/g.365252 Transcript_126197/m.365252 type:complete len:239 (-) Transcript_126197:882-1598(-)